MYKTKDSEGLWWRFYNKPTASDDGWVSYGHVAYLPNHEDTPESWQNSLTEV